MKVTELKVGNIYKVNKKSNLYPIYVKYKDGKEKEVIKLLSFHDKGTWININNLRPEHCVTKDSSYIFIAKEKLRLYGKVKLTAYKFWCIEHAEFFYFKSKKLRFLTEAI